jgi:hypothetical protein
VNSGRRCSCHPRNDKLPTDLGGYCSHVTSAAGAQASLMHKRQRRGESERLISSTLTMHMLQVPLSRVNKVDTSPAARGAVSAINSTFEAEEGGQAPSAIEL